MRTWTELEFEGMEFVVRPRNEDFDSGMFTFYIEHVPFVAPELTYRFASVIQLAGYDPNKVDYAVPQDFFDKHGNGYVWYYGGEHTLFGEPVSKRTIERKARNQLIKLTLNKIMETYHGTHS